MSIPVIAQTMCFPRSGIIHIFVEGSSDSRAGERKDKVSNVISPSFLKYLS